MKSDKQSLCELQNYRCCWCGNPLTLVDATIEHIIPRSLGGKDRYSNKAISHRHCNRGRGNDLLQPPHPSFLFDHVRKRLREYHEGIARQDISKLNLPVPAVRWLG